MIIYMTDEQRSLDHPELVFPRWIRVECNRVIPWDLVGGTVIRLCGKEIGEFYHISNPGYTRTWNLFSDVVYFNGTKYVIDNPTVMRKCYEDIVDALADEEVEKVLATV